jgi:hypothetical protein
LVFPLYLLVLLVVAPLVQAEQLLLALPVLQYQHALVVLGLLLLPVSTVTQHPLLQLLLLRHEHIGYLQSC